MNRLLILLISTLLFSCDMPDATQESKDTNIRLCENCRELKQVTLEGCEYFYIGNRHSSSFALSHKGNCSNSIHKK